MMVRHPSLRHPSGKCRSLRSNSVWGLLGNTLYGVSQWVLLVVLAKFGTAETVGQFALSLAISAPTFLCLGMNLRIVQATDADRVWRLVDYLRLRLLLGVAALIVTAVVGLALGMRGEALLVLLVVAAAKGSEARSQTLYGYFQLHERMDLVSQSMIARALLGSALFGAAMATTRSLLVACLGLWAGWLVVSSLLERRSSRMVEQGDPARVAEDDARWDWPAMRRLARKAVPLGVDGGLVSLTLSVPSYVVAGVLGTAGLGIYAALAYTSQIVGRITASVAETVVPRLAVYYARGRRRPFLVLLGKLTLLGTVVSTACVVAAAALGGPFLRVFLGEKYDDVALLVVLMVSAGILTLQRCVGRGLQAAHRFVAVVTVNAVTLVVIAAVAPVLISVSGLVGAAWALCAGSAAGTAVGLVFLSWVVASLGNGQSARQVENVTTSERSPF